MLKISNEDSSILILNHDDIKKDLFLISLSEKINKAPTLEKVAFFHLLKHQILLGKINFSHDDKAKFLHDFTYDDDCVSSNKIIFGHKTTAYICPVGLSVYTPEFFETINELFTGKDVPIPVLTSIKQQNISDEKIIHFWEKLTPTIEKLENDPTQNFMTLLLIKYLKQAGNDLPITADWFYSAFRKIDVIEDDEIYFDFALEGYTLGSKGKFTFSKDLFVWKALKSSPENIELAEHFGKKLFINTDFLEELRNTLL